MERKGICKNVGVCSQAGKVQVITDDDAEFVCTECGSELEEAKEEIKGYGPGTGDDKKKKLIIIIAAAVVVIGGAIGAIIGLGGGSNDDEAAMLEAARKADSIRIADSLRMADEMQPEEAPAAISLVINQGMFEMTVGGSETLVATFEPADAEVTLSYASNDEKVAMVSSTGEIHALAEGETFITVTAQPKSGNPATARANVTVTKKKAAPAGSNATSGSSNLGWGSYSGPMQGGKPHGAGGTIKVKQSYSIDLKDGRGGKIEVRAGETIENTKFENGRLRAGELHRADGTRKWFNC